MTCALTINETLKHGTLRQFMINSQLIVMLNVLPRNLKPTYSTKTQHTALVHFAYSFRRTWKRLAVKMQNPNLDRITFHTFRHWYATMLFHKTKNLTFVQERLGHKSILTTTIYTHLIKFGADSYHSASSRAPKRILLPLFWSC